MWNLSAERATVAILILTGALSATTKAVAAENRTQNLSIQPPLNGKRRSSLRPDPLNFHLARQTIRFTIRRSLGIVRAHGPQRRRTRSAPHGDDTKPWPSLQLWRPYSVEVGQELLNSANCGGPRSVQYGETDRESELFAAAHPLFRRVVASRGSCRTRHSVRRRDMAAQSMPAW